MKDKSSLEDIVDKKSITVEKSDKPEIPWASQVMREKNYESRQELESPIKRWWLKEQKKKGIIYYKHGDSYGLKDSKKIAESFLEEIRDKIGMKERNR